MREALILPPGGSPVGIYTQPSICRHSALLIIHVQARGRTCLSLSGLIPSQSESLGGGGGGAFQAHLDPRLHSQDWSGVGAGGSGGGAQKV